MTPRLGASRGAPGPHGLASAPVPLVCRHDARPVAFGAGPTVTPVDNEATCVA